MVDGGIVANKLKLWSLLINDSEKTGIQVDGSLSKNRVLIQYVVKNNRDMTERVFFINSNNITLH